MTYFVGGAKLVAESDHPTTVEFDVRAKVILSIHTVFAVFPVYISANHNAFIGHIS